MSKLAWDSFTWCCKTWLLSLLSWCFQFVVLDVEVKFSYDNGSRRICEVSIHVCFFKNIYFLHNFLHIDSLGPASTHILIEKLQILDNRNSDVYLLPVCADVSALLYWCQLSILLWQCCMVSCQPIERQLFMPLWHMFSGCLGVCPHVYRLFFKLRSNVYMDSRKNWLDFGGQRSHKLWPHKTVFWPLPKYSYAYSDPISHKFVTEQNDEVISFNIQWVIQEQKGRLWLYFTFGCILSIYVLDFAASLQQHP